MLGITWGELKKSHDPQGVEYDATPQHDDPWTEKPQRAISEAQLNLFNRDLDSMAALYGQEPIRVLLEKYQREALVVARNVMYGANQPYGGANALGNEIAMRALRPVDVNAHGVNVHIWDVNLAGSALGNVWGYQSGGAAPAPDTMGEEEGNIIVGFVDPVVRPAFVAYQVAVNANRFYAYFTMNWDLTRSDSVPMVEVSAPILEFPEDTVLLNMAVGYPIGVDRTQSVGMHFARARVMAAVAGSA